MAAVSAVSAPLGQARPKEQVAKAASIDVAALIAERKRVLGYNCQ